MRAKCSGFLVPTNVIAPTVSGGEYQFWSSSTIKFFGRQQRAELRFMRVNCCSPWFMQPCRQPQVCFLILLHSLTSVIFYCQFVLWLQENKRNLKAKLSRAGKNLQENTWLFLVIVINFVNSDIRSQKHKHGPQSYLYALMAYFIIAVRCLYSWLNNDATVLNQKHKTTVSIPKELTGIHTNTMLTSLNLAPKIRTVSMFEIFNI